MSYFSVPDTYNLSAAQSDVPNSLTSSRFPRPVSSVKQIVSIASTSATQNAGGLISFAIPTGAGSNAYLVNNSVYLRCTVSFSAQLAATAGGGVGVRFALPSASAHALINRLTVSVGATQVSQYNNYHILSEELLIHTTSRNFIKDDCAILMGTECLLFPQNTTAANAVIEVCIPLISPLFSGSQSLPLFLLNAPIHVQIDLNTSASALKVAAPDTNLTFTISNAYLVYETLAMSPDYCNSIRAEMSKGQLYQLNLTDYLTMTTGSAQTLNYLVGCNLSSVKGVLFTQVDATPTNVEDLVLSSNGLNNIRVYADGRLINNTMQLSSDAVIFAEMNRALGNMFDSNITTFLGALGNLGQDSRDMKGRFLSTYFLGGISLNRVNDAGLTMTGTACQNINLLLDHGATYAGGFNTYIIIIYDQILTIDAFGNVQLVK
jgi:hypothetical protein